MSESKEKKTESVSVTMELNGEYGEVISKLASVEDDREELRAIVADFGRLLDTVDGIDGGTKSVIVEHLPGDMAEAYDSDAVVIALQVLEQYDIVTLDGNTWRIT